MESMISLIMLCSWQLMALQTLPQSCKARLVCTGSLDCMCQLEKLEELQLRCSRNGDEKAGLGAVQAPISSRVEVIVRGQGAMLLATAFAHKVRHSWQVPGGQKGILALQCCAWLVEHLLLMLQRLVADLNSHRWGQI